MSTRARLTASLLGLALVLTACTGGGDGEQTVGPTLQSTSSQSPTPGESPSPVPTGPGSAAAALAKLCAQSSSTPPSEVPPEGPTPPAVSRVERQVEELRELHFADRVVVDPMNHAELVEELAESFDSSFPRAFYRRRSLAWQAIGAIPNGVSIRRSLESFMSTQVIGFYDTQTHELVFMGSKDPTAIERYTLAHELTHAIDDQHFGLRRLDKLSAACRDDVFDAALAVVEGDAEYVGLAYAQQFLTTEEQLQLINQPVPSTAGIPPFVLKLETWPYTAGFTFVLSLVREGGTQAVDHALTHLPVSTEQIIHPELYPADVPQAVDIPDLAPKLGPGWSDLDVEEVGEEWLSLLLELRIGGTSAAAAAAGWDGGIYRAWSDGDHVAVMMATVWDTPGDASEFAQAMQQWIDAGADQPAFVPSVRGQRVEVLFASDASTLGSLRQAVA